MTEQKKAALSMETFWISQMSIIQSTSFTSPSCPSKHLSNNLENDNFCCKHLDCSPVVLQLQYEGITQHVTLDMACFCQLNHKPTSHPGVFLSDWMKVFCNVI